MPAKDKDPKSPPSPTKPRAKAKPIVEDRAVSPAPKKKAATRSRAKLSVAETVAPDAPAPDAIAAPKRRRAPKRAAAGAADGIISSSEATTASAAAVIESASIDSRSPRTSEILSDVSPSREAEIRLRAYLIYAERGYRPGSPESDWFQAEQEVGYGRQA